VTGVSSTHLAISFWITRRNAAAPPQDLARQVGARFVIDGLLEAHGDLLQISVQVADGWTGTQTFADEMELPVASWFEAAPLVVGRLARALQFELNDLAIRPVADPGGASKVDAHALALTAQAWVALFARVQTRETNALAAPLAEQAVAQAPGLSQSWMCKAFAEWRAGQYGWTDEPYQTMMQRALASAERAVELDPRDPDAHYVLGVVAWTHGQLLRAEEVFQQCLRLTRSYAPAHALLGLVRGRLGFAADTAAHCERAFALSAREPLRAVWHHFNAVASLALGDSQAALEHV